MNFSEWITSKQLKDAEIASLLGVSVPAANNYRRGLRIPKSEIMTKITSITNGQVTANDFYPTAPTAGE